MRRSSICSNRSRASSWRPRALIAVDVPEAADGEGGGGGAELVLLVAEEIAALAERFERLDGSCEAGVGGVEEAEVVEQQQAGVYANAVEGGGEAAAALGVVQDVLADRFGPAGPVRLTVGQTECLPDACQTVAGGPAHDAREGVDGAPLPELPEPGVGLVEQCSGLTAELLQPAEYARVPRFDQPPVEEALGDGEDRAAVVVVLELTPGGVAHPHRPHAAVTREVVDGALGQFPLRT